VKPELRQFGSLTAEDLERVPVWLACHIADYDEAWYDETDEETFRPYSGSLPMSPGDEMYLVKATATLAGGSTLPGCLTPATGNDLGLAQPQVFIGGRMFAFWGGGAGIPQQERDEFYAALGKDPGAVFPLEFTVAAALVQGGVSLQVDGFYRSPDFKAIVVEQ